MTKKQLEKINSILSEKYGDRVIAKFSDNILTLSGELDSYSEVVSLCKSLADKKKRRYFLVNDLTVKGAHKAAIRLPKIKDNSLENSKVDVLIIGGGISGTSIFRELSRYDLDILLVDKEEDIAMHASSRNDGEVHPGIDLKVGLLKQKYNILGNKMYDKLCDDLGVDFKRNGQYVLFYKKSVAFLLKLVAFKWRKLGITGTKILNKKQLLAAEPSVNTGAVGAIYTPTAGVVCPYNLCIAYAENAISNGAKLSLNTAVLGMELSGGEIVAVKTNRGTIYPKIVINAGGVFAEEIAKMADDRFYSIHPRKGTNAILDKKAGHLANSILADLNLSSKKTKNSKGGGIIRTVDDNILVGPDAFETMEFEDFSTSKSSIDAHMNKYKHVSEKLSGGDVITCFSGIRAPTFEEDFVIEKGRKTKNLVHVAGIQSPGLTAAPAIAKEVERITIELLSKNGIVGKKANFIEKRKPIVRLKDMSLQKRDALIKQNPSYGEIVCRCEEISKGEIIDALNGGIRVRTLDGVKRRVRPGMGRCQGGFCSPLVNKIIADHYGERLEDVLKSTDGSTIVYGDTK